MNKPKKVVAYVCDVPIPNTDEVISAADQKARILKHAAKEGFEVVAFIEDEKFTEDFADRPGVREFLAGVMGVDCVLVERVWSVTRNRHDLEAVMGELDKRGTPLVATSYLWDCLSQMARHRYMGSKAQRPVQPAAEARMAA